MRNSLLNDAVAAFLDHATERQLDEPLLALLRARRYDELHLVHGHAEFGKDVIGQREEEQWAFQSKAGNIGQADWRQLTGQLDELRLSNLSHPAFRTDLQRRPVLVLTGRLTGNAPLSAQEYNARAADRDEPQLEIWGRDRLLGELAGNPDALLRGSADGQLLGMLAAIDDREVDLDRIELFSRRWVSWEPGRIAGLGVIEAALVCERLARNDRLDLACQVALSLVGGAVAASWDDLAGGLAAVEAAGNLFEGYARALWDECDERLLRDSGLIGFSGNSAWVSYQIRCTRVAELLGLLALRVRGDDRGTADEIAAWLAEFVAAQPGVARPLGDRYAVGLIPAALALREHESALRDLLVKTTVWVCDRYERGQLGLAASDAFVDEEIARTLGSSIGFPIERRRSSLVASVLLDLAASFELSDVYRDIRNDILAVRIHCPVLIPPEDSPESLSKPAVTAQWDHDADYADELSDEPAAPHLEMPTEHRLVQAGLWWELLAVSAVLRDRWFQSAILAADSATKT